MSAQDGVLLGTTPEETDSRLSVSGFSYPTFLNDETHSEFTVRYPLDESFEAELQGFYDTFILADVTRFALRGKYYPGGKFYFFSGMATEFERDKSSGKTMPPRLMMLNGIGQDFSNGLILEVKHELLINTYLPGHYAIPNLISVHGKYKF